MATTPRITVTLRAAYGGAHIVMNSRDLGADLTMAWPHAKIGVMGPRQAVEIVNRREIAAGADADALSDAYAAEHLPVRGGRLARASSTRSSRRARRASASPSRWRPLGDASGRRGHRGAKSVQTRNATEEAILDAARAALAEKGFDALTMDAIARKAFVSRTAVYFYFPNKRAVVDRLIQQCFSEMYLAASPYLDGDGDPRRELRASLARVVAVVNGNAGLLLLAAQLSGARGEHLPEEWEPYIMRFVERAEARIARDQEHGIAPDDIAPRLSAQALLAMVENHITRELVLKRGDANESIRTLAELWWRAVYSRPGAAAPA